MNITIDLAASLILLATTLVALAAYATRVIFHGRARSERVEREGESLIIRKGAMETTLWVMGPIGEACVRLGITANAVTWSSLAFGLMAGVAIASAHFGVAAALAALAALGDALDGVVARASGELSDSGAILDAAIDRYVELAFIGGLAFYFREHPFELILGLCAIAGAFMVSYGSAKAEALRVAVPRGSMRRAERVLLLVVGVGLAPIVSAVPAIAEWSDGPAVVALALIATVGNVSAVRRLAAAARATKGLRRTSEAVAIVAVERRAS